MATGLAVLRELVSGTTFLELAVLPVLYRPQRTLFLLQSGPHAGRWLSAIPRDPVTTIRPSRMQVALRRRVRLPLVLAARWCDGRTCRKELDAFGDHRAACMRTGRVRRRAKPLERIWARILREAGARVQERAVLRDMGTPAVLPSGDSLKSSRPVYHSIMGCPWQWT